MCFSNKEAEQHSRTKEHHGDGEKMSGGDAVTPTSTYTRAKNVTASGHQPFKPFLTLTSSRSSKSEAGILKHGHRTLALCCCHYRIFLALEDVKRRTSFLKSTLFLIDTVEQEKWSF